MAKSRWLRIQCVNRVFALTLTGVSPIEIERILSEHPAALEAAVVFRKDADELIKPVACIVPRGGTRGSPELASELQSLVRSRLPVFKRLHGIEFFTELPKTATGKVQRFKLRAWMNECSPKPSV